MQSDLEKEYHSLSQLDEIQRLYNSPNLTVREALFVTTQLVNQGFSEAAGAIRALRTKLPQGAAQEYLDRLERRLNVILALPQLQRIRASEDAVRDLYATSGFVFRPGSFRASVAIVVFTSKFNNYHVSNVVFDALLAELGVARLFLKDTTASIYFRGVEGLCQDLQALPHAIENFLSRNGCDRAIITGFSSGGYAALYTALHIENVGCVGFSTHTDISPSSRLPLLNLFHSLRGQIPDDNLLDLRTLFEQARTKSPFTLYVGAKDPIDRAHAMRLSRFDNVKVVEVPDAGHHVTSALMERGELAHPFIELLQSYSKLEISSSEDPC